ncbi:MAG TPA: HAD-IIIA family hydrolase [Burkholderiales bacterium]|nr:HAD-IIIA family hydrolase [Burkholderiales bacterium]
MRRIILERARRVRVAFFDVDGVLTDGRLYFSARGEQFKAFHILDGHGLKMLRESGVTTAILSGRRSGAVKARAAELGIAHVVQAAADKLPAFLALLRKLRLAERDAAYMGDDLPDLPVMRRCGLALSVPDAVEVVRSHAHYVTDRPGGRGAVREACELIMRAQGTLEARMENYLR